MERPPIIPIDQPAEAPRPPRIAVPGATKEASPAPAKKGKGKKAAAAPAVEAAPDPVEAGTDSPTGEGEG